MKRLHSFLFGVVTLLPVLVYSGDPSPWPPAGTEVEVFKSDGGSWVNLGSGNPAADARAFTSYPVTVDSNLDWFVTGVQNHTSMAQWTKWAITGGVVGYTMFMFQELMSFPESTKGNKPKENAFLQNLSSAAQRVQFSMSATRWDWFLRKPGCYAAIIDGIALSSEYDSLDMLFDGFEDFLYQD